MALGSTVQDIALSVLAATASDAGPQLAVRWINERYVEFVGRARTQQLRHNASVFVPAPLSAGTVSVTQGSATVIGTGTAFVAGTVGWQFRVGINWYTILSVNVATQTLTLDSAYSEASNTAATYFALQRFIPTVPDCRWITNVSSQRVRRRLRHLSTNELTERYTSKQDVGSFPRVWAEVPRFVEDTDLSSLLGQTGQKLFEVYPPSLVPETYNYEYWSVPQTLGFTSTLPPEIDEYVLREGVLVDVYRYKSEQAMQKALSTGNIDFSRLAEIYANKESRQRTIWEQCIQAGLVADAAHNSNVQVELTTGDEYWDEHYDDDLDGDHSSPTQFIGGDVSKTMNITIFAPTAGSATYSQTDDGTFKVYMNAYYNASAVAQTIAYPTPFIVGTPIFIENTDPGAVTSAVAITLPSSMTGPVTGWIIVAGLTQ